MAPPPKPTPFSRIRLDYSPLRKKRRELEMSQTALARAIGANKSTIWRIETGRTVPSALQQVILARALGTPVHLLYFVHDE